ncbi:MAG: TatD family hydrolase [Candidatus Pacebacteria bacterium]|nr:TatD family hydrolase [Candidatus Paceibacterota bacterium]
MKLIDTHAHINFANYKEDADTVIRNSLRENIGMVLVGSEYKTSKRALEYANKYEKGVYVAVGLHPIHLQDVLVENQGDEGNYKFRTRAEEFNFDNYQKLAEFNKVVAIGEIGLDYYHINFKDDVSKIKAKQKSVFLEQLNLARKMDLPAIIHCRQAHDDLYQILEDFKAEHKDSIDSSKPWGVIHCFSGDLDLAWKYFNLGLFISFTGLITFSRQFDDVIRKVPLDKIMIETDSPYMTPEPYRGHRNEPALVYYVAEHIAKLRNIDISKVAKATTDNAKRFFGIV